MEAHCGLPGGPGLFGFSRVSGASCLGGSLSKVKRANEGGGAAFFVRVLHLCGNHDPAIGVFDPSKHSSLNEWNNCLSF